MDSIRSRRSPSESLAAMRTRALVPLILTALVFAYEILWKSRINPERVLTERLLDLLLFLLVGPVMAWWGLGIAGGLLQKLAKSEAATEEKSRLLEQRNRQLQTILQASRTMGGFLNLQQLAEAVVQQVIAHTRFTKASLVLAGEEELPWQMAASQGLPSSHLSGFMAGLTGPQRSASPVEWCRVTLQPVVVEDLVKDYRTAALREVWESGAVEAVVGVPLICRDRFRGALMVYLEKGGPISTAEISLVSALAAQAALMIENARLFTATSHTRGRLDQAVEFLQRISSDLAHTRVGVGPLLQTVAGATAKLFEPARVRLEVTTSSRRTPYTVQAESFGTEALAGTAPARTVALPVTLDGQHFGQFEIDLCGSPHIDEVESRILQAFVHLTASAIGNASLVGEMRLAVEEVERAYMGTLEALIKALEIRDHETEGHSRRVVQYTLALSQQLGVPESELVPIMRGALLHDIGKIGIPDAILRKPGPLTADEWEIMRQHTRFGHEMLRGIEFLAEATPVILHHHERWDGRGYPDGLAGEEIPLGARIFAVADAYDAITSNRPYRKGRSHGFALTEIRAGAGTQFDADVVEALLELPESELSRIRGRDLEATPT